MRWRNAILAGVAVAALATPVMAKVTAPAGARVFRLDGGGVTYAMGVDEKGYLQPFVPFESFGDPETLSCDRDSQGDVFFADMSHSVSRSRALDDIAEGLLPQRWMGKKIIPVYQSYGCDIDAEWQVGASEWWITQNGLGKTLAE